MQLIRGNGGILECTIGTYNDGKREEIVGQSRRVYIKGWYNRVYIVISKWRGGGGGSPAASVERGLGGEVAGTGTGTGTGTTVSTSVTTAAAAAGVGTCLTEGQQ